MAIILNASTSTIEASGTLSLSLDGVEMVRLVQGADDFTRIVAGTPTDLTANSGFLIIGDPTDLHLSMDNNIIQCKVLTTRCCTLTGG